MGQAKEKDVGLAYLQKIGFNRIRGKYGLADRWINIFGRSTAEKLRKQWENMEERTLEFYNFKNSNPELSKSFSEAFDSDIIRKSCCYIFEHKEYFGKTILEVGCDVGYMSGFLALTFPDSKIIAIDRCEAAINLAKAFTAKLGVTNIEYKHCSLSEIKEEYDTVFCMRTIKENIDLNNAPFIGEPLNKQILTFESLTETYTTQLLSCLKETGHLCIFERVEHDPLMCGWLMQLNYSECGIIPDTYKEFVCDEASTQNTFQAFICQPGITMPIQDIIHLWYKALDIDCTGKTKLIGWNALAYLADNAGELIRGMRVIAENGKQVGRFALFRDKDGEPKIYYLIAAGGNEQDIQMLSFNATLEKEVIENFLKQEEQNKRAGFTIEEIDADDDFLEGRCIETENTNEQQEDPNNI